MNLLTIKIAAVLSLAAVMSPRGASAQIMGPLLPESAMELGLRARWVQADMDQGASSAYVDQYDFSFPARIGVTRYATLSAELFAGNQDAHSLEHDLRYYTLGGGFQALVWEKEPYVVSGAVHFSETLIIDRSGGECDREQFTLLATIQVQRTFQYRGQNVVLWGGGAQYYFSDDVVDGNNCTASGWNNSRTIGIVAGANLLLFDHAQIYYHFIYVDYYQPHLGVAYRF